MALSVKILEDVTGHNFDLATKRQWMICPSPIIADALRTNLQQQGENSLETLTIAKFMNDIFSHYFPDHQMMRKSDLKLILSVIWKARFQNSEEENVSFNQCFDILTDLRSYTLDLHLFESVLENFSEDISICVKYFWLVMQEQNLIDEHAAYQALYEYFSGSDIDISFIEETSLIFNGFSHLSMNQILFMKALSMRIDIIIPIARRVYEKRQPGDWIEWIIRESSDLQVAPDDDYLDPALYPIDIVYYTKGKLTPVMAALIKNNDKPFDNIILAQNELGFEDSLLTTEHDTFFRVKSDILDEMFHHIFNDLEKIFFTGEFSTVRSEDFLLEIKKQIHNTFSQSKNFKVFARLKILTLLYDRLLQWMDLSEVNEAILLFDLFIIKEVLHLDLPRMFNQPLVKDITTTLISLKEMSMAIEGRNLICFSSGHDLKSEGAARSYSFDVYQVLQTLGPTRRKNLDNEFVIDLMFVAFSRAKTTLAIERGLEVHDATIERILKATKSQLVEVRVEDSLQSVHKPIDLKNPEKTIDKISASRMQTYLDCPRKYYYQYVEKISLEPKRLRTIDPRLLGSLQHKVVEHYCSLEKEWSDEKLKDIIKNEIKNYFPDDLLCHLYSFQEIFIETYHYTKDICQNLMKLGSLDPTLEYHFEVDLKSYGGVGSIDLLVKSSLLGDMLIDIKRSGASIPSRKKFLELKSIQLWHYAHFLQKTDFSLLGYLNLKDLSESLVFILSEETRHKLESIEFLGLKKYEIFKEPFSESIDHFAGLYQKTLESLNSNNFDIDPVDAQICTFCPGAIICPKK